MISYVISVQDFSPVCTALMNGNVGYGIRGSNACTCNQAQYLLHNLHRYVQNRCCRRSRHVRVTVLMVCVCSRLAPAAFVL